MHNACLLDASINDACMDMDMDMVNMDDENVRNLRFANFNYNLDTESQVQNIQFASLGIVFLIC